MPHNYDYQRINGINLCVHRFYDNDVPSTGLTLILLHGFLDAGSTWDLVAKPLTRAGHHVLAPDLRGFGRSESIGPGGYYHFPDYVADIAALIDAVAPSRLGLVGHSMGGSVAVYYTGTFPARVERLVLLEGIGPLSMPDTLAVDCMQGWLQALRDLKRAPRRVSSLEDATAKLVANHPRIPRDVLATRAGLLTHQDDNGHLVWDYDPLHRTPAPMLFRADAFKQFLARITCPTLIVSGGTSGWHVPDEDERIAALKQAHRFELPNAGHMMHWSEPNLLAERLIAFFAGQ